MRLHIIKITWLLALLPLLLSCSNEEERIGTNPPAIEADEALIRLKFDLPKSGKARTYAGEVFNANDDEKEIRSIAIFTKNRDEGSGEDLKRGAFNKFFSTEDLRTATGLYEPMEGGNGSYTTTVKIRSNGFGDDTTQVFIIANYAENGLTQKLKDVRTYGDLLKLTIDPLTDKPVAPLLMVSEQKVKLVNGGTVDENFEMQRMVSRIDIDNLAEANGFTLTSAHIANPRTYAYFAGGVDAAANIPVTTEFSPLTPDAATPTKINCLYTYESDNSKTATATAVVVKGMYNGIHYEKRIPLKQPDKDGVTGEPIPLARNFRYLIKLQPSQDPNQLDWTVKVAQWADGEVVEVKPPSVVPDLIDFSFGTNTNADDWFANEMRYEFKDHVGDVVEFTARSMHPTNFSYTCTYWDDTDASEVFGFDSGNSLDVVRHAPVITYATVDQKYTVTMPALVNEAKGPFSIVLSIESSLNRYNKKDITFSYAHGPRYPGTSEYAVLVDGIFWAPVNVGATEIGYTQQTKHMGKLFQYGRNNSGVDYYIGVNPEKYQGQTPSRYITYDESRVSDWDNKSIVTSQAYFPGNQVLDWLTRTAAEHEKRQAAWKESNGPCPMGWKVPSYAQLVKLQTRIGNKIPLANNGFTVDGDYAGQKLYLPAAGIRDWSGPYSQCNVNGFYFSNEYFQMLSAGNVQASTIKILQISNNSSSLVTQWPSNSMSVRCVFDTGE